MEMGFNKDSKMELEKYHKWESMREQKYDNSKWAQ